MEEDWGTHHSQSESPNSFYRHDDEWSPGKGERDEVDWMEQESERDLKDKETWLEKGSRDGAGLGTERAEFGSGSEDDVYMQLAQKEQDLMLAAELGKALLEKNQELEEQMARLTEEFSQKLEVLEQERHSLQSQLTQRQGEYENTIRDLQDDVSNLQEQLRHHDSQTSAGERKHVQDLRKLQQHNEQLSEQLRQSLAQQQTLSAEAGQLREQLTSRRSKIHQRVDHVDKLEDEVEYLRQRHQELEAQIRQVKEERDALATELDALHERLLMLEKQRLLQDEQLQHQTTELQELRDTNSILQSRLEQVTSRCHTSGDSPTLFSELSHLNDLNISPPASFIQFHNGERVSCLSADMLEEDDFEYDDDIFCDVITHSSPLPHNLGCHGNKTGNSLHEELMCQLEQSDLQASCREGEEECGATGGGYTRLMLSSPSRHQVALTDELQDLLKDMYSDDDDDEAEDGRTAGNRGGYVATAHQETDPDVTEMTYEPSHSFQEREGGGERREKQESLRSLNRQSQHYFNEMLQTQQSRIEKLERRVQELECRVQELQQERDKLQDAACGDVTVSHVLQQTRGERDNAMGRISDMERELTRLTGEVVTLNGQLMDTIRRKVVISQELDQWQIDLSEVLALQMHRRMREQQKVEQAMEKFQEGLSSDQAPFKKQNR